jgi:hypothetical protein
MKRQLKLLQRGVLSSALLLLPVSALLAEPQVVPVNANAGGIAQTSVAVVPQGDFDVSKHMTTLVTDEMRLHMDSARLADSSRDYNAAADELRRVQAHVQSQLAALQHANTYLTRLITDTQNGKVRPADLDLAFTQIRHASNRSQVWVPIASDEVDVFRPEMDYHLSRARKEWHAGLLTSASTDVRLAVDYLRLRQSALSVARSDRSQALQQAEDSLIQLAARIQDDKHLSTRQLDKAFTVATTAWNGSF